MYASIRHHRFNPDVVDEVIAWVEKEFVPELRKLPGFLAYYGIQVARRDLHFVSVYDNRKSAMKANDLAREMARTRWKKLEQGEPATAWGKVVVAHPAMAVAVAERRGKD